MDLRKNSKIQCNFFNNFISQTHGECGLHFKSIFYKNVHKLVKAIMETAFITI